MSSPEQTGPTKTTRDGAEARQASADGQTVTLVKGRNRWTFTYAPGEESGLLAAVSGLAERGDASFDWFDAALVSHQVARRLRARIRRTSGTAAAASAAHAGGPTGGHR